MPRERGKKSLSSTQQRKKEHLELCLDSGGVTAPYRAGLDRYAFLHNALPEVNIDEIDLRTTFLGKPLKAPLLISSMTGGFELAQKVNRNLARACQQLGLAMGVGSQRVAIEEPSVADSFKVRDLAPDILLLGNLGAVQLNYGYSLEQCRQAVRMIQADGLILHLNALQEAVQPEGNRNFKGLTDKIAEVCRELRVPVLAKEVGSGISADVALRLKRAGVKAIDVAGRGGTSWYMVEGRRAAQKGQPVSLTFADWGLPTEEAVVMVRETVPDLEIVASGGIRSGLDIAKAIALGANIAAMGQPLLEPALESAEQVIKFLAGIIYEIKVTMLCVGVTSIAALSKVPLIQQEP